MSVSGRRGQRGGLVAVKTITTPSPGSERAKTRLQTSDLPDGDVLRREAEFAHSDAHAQWVGSQWEQQLQEPQTGAQGGSLHLLVPQFRSIKTVNNDQTTKIVSL